MEFPMGGTPTPVVDNPMPSAAPAAAPEQTPAATPTPATPSPRSTDMLNALLDGADPGSLGLTTPPAAATPPQPAAPAAPPAQPGQGPAAAAPNPGEPGIEIPDKFKNPDGTPNTEALMKSYIGMEKVLGEQGNKLGQMGQMQNELLQLRNIVQQLSAPPPGQPGQPQAPAAPAEEAPKFPWEVEMTAEEKEIAQEEYFADPIAAIAKRDQQTMKAMEHRMNEMLKNVLEPLAPVVESHQHGQQVQTFTEQIGAFKSSGVAPDFDAFTPQMTQIVEQYGDWLETLPNPIEVVYRMAKGMAASTPAAPAPTLEDMLKDPASREKILADPSIQTEIARNYVSKVASNAPPVVIGAQPGGVAPAAPGERPTSVREAGKMFSRYLNQS